LNGYGLIQIKPEANSRDEARRIAANIAKLVIAKGVKIKGPDELKKAKPHGGSLPGGLAFIPLRCPSHGPVGLSDR
jgi:hypothetical protein